MAYHFFTTPLRVGPPLGYRMRHDDFWYVYKSAPTIVVLAELHALSRLVISLPAAHMQVSGFMVYRGRRYCQWGMDVYEHGGTSV